MSNTTETMPETTIRIDPVPGRGQRRVRVAVMHGDTAVHLDTVQIENARSRAAFIATAEQRAESLGIEVNRVRIENALLQDAMQVQPAAAAPAAQQPDSSEVLEAFGIDVLGEMDDQSIMCWIYLSLESVLPSDGMRNSTVARCGVSSATSRNPSLTNSMTSAGILYFSAMSLMTWSLIVAFLRNRFRRCVGGFNYPCPLV